MKNNHIIPLCCGLAGAFLAVANIIDEIAFVLSKFVENGANPLLLTHVGLVVLGSLLVGCLAISMMKMSHIGVIVSGVLLALYCAFYGVRGALRPHTFLPFTNVTTSDFWGYLLFYALTFLALIFMTSTIIYSFGMYVNDEEPYAPMWLWILPFFLQGLALGARTIMPLLDGSGLDGFDLALGICLLLLVAGVTFWFSHPMSADAFALVEEDQMQAVRTVAMPDAATPSPTPIRHLTEEEKQSADYLASLQYHQQAKAAYYRQKAEEQGTCSPPENKE
ncbi:MAG: hypothetical protein J6R42_04890 [Clostridia bacterium]|nr:hypothetical protein [Clostridia bacterium]